METANIHIELRLRGAVLAGKATYLAMRWLGDDLAKAAAHRVMFRLGRWRFRGGEWQRFDEPRIVEEETPKPAADGAQMMVPVRFEVV